MREAATDPRIAPEIPPRAKRANQPVDEAGGKPASGATSSMAAIMERIHESPKTFKNCQTSRRRRSMRKSGGERMRVGEKL